MENEGADKPPIIGTPPTEEDQQWAASADALTPVRASERIDDYSKTLLSTVTLVGAVLTGLGLVSGATVAADPTSRVIAAVAIATALASVITALSAFSLMQSVNVFDLSALRQFYIAKASRAPWAGRLLGIALVTAMLAALTVVFLPKKPEVAPSLSLVSSKSAVDVTLRLSAAELQPDAVVSGWLLVPSPRRKRRDNRPCD